MLIYLMTRIFITLNYADLTVYQIQNIYIQLFIKFEHVQYDLYCQDKQTHL